MAYANNVIYSEHLFSFTWGPGPAVLVQPLGEKGGGARDWVAKVSPEGSLTSNKNPGHQG